MRKGGNKKMENSRTSVQRVKITGLLPLHAMECTTT